MGYGNMWVGLRKHTGWATGIQCEPQPPTLCIQLSLEHVYVLGPPISGPTSPQAHTPVELQLSRMSVNQTQPQTTLTPYPTEYHNFGNVDTRQVHLPGWTHKLIGPQTHGPTTWQFIPNLLVTNLMFTLPKLCHELAFFTLFFALFFLTFTNTILQT